MASIVHRVHVLHNETTENIHLAGIRSTKHALIKGVNEFLTCFARFLTDMGKIRYRRSPYKAVEELRM